MAIVDFVDNGTGIGLDERDMIFEKFARLDGHGGQGAGLGLAICREIITRLGGDINYLAEGPGTGFRVTFPVSKEQIATKAGEITAPV